MNALPVSQIDKQWSLFLDRDGVINRRIVDAYVRDPSEFVFLPRVPEAMALLRRTFGYVFLVTNQQGIGKGLMGVDDLERVHAYMESALDYPFDHIYFCPDLASSGSRFRKPETGMALQAQRDFPEVDFHRSVMVGDNITDMQFASNAHMRAVYITKNNPVPDSVRDITDIHISSLSTF